MPIYEYLCDSCGHEQEAIQKFSDAPLSDCESCGAPRLRRKISAAGFRLKGGGWYETDFKDGKRRNVAEDGGGSSSGNADSGKGKGTESGSSSSGGSASDSGSSKSGGSESSGKAASGGDS